MPEPRVRDPQKESGTIYSLKDPKTCDQLKFYIVTNLIVHKEVGQGTLGYNPDHTFPAHMTGFEEGITLAARHPELALKMLDDIRRVHNDSENDLEMDREMDQIANATREDWTHAAYHFAHPKNDGKG